MRQGWDVVDLIGHTPLVHLSSLSVENGGQVYAKIESFNPSGSIKDRIVDYMLRRAFKEGALRERQTVVEASSGNTAASLAMLASCFNVKAKLFVPAETSIEKINAVKLFGAEVFCVSKEHSVYDEIDYMRAARICAREERESYFLDQYDNFWNGEAHYHGLGSEILTHFNGKIDCFVATGSTGGTISGVGKRLREKCPDIRIVLADPKGSVYHGAYYGTKEAAQVLKCSKIEGSGKMKIAGNMDFSVIDEVVPFSEKEAVRQVFDLHCKEGLMVGLSSGANAFVAAQIACRYDHPSTIVTVFPDTSLKYTSKLQNSSWLASLEL